MERIWTTELAARAGETVLLKGWLHRLRRLSHVSFLVLRDGKGTAQIVVDEPALAAELAALPAESALAVVGEAVAEPQAPGGVELRRPRVEVVSRAAAPPPFDLFRPALKAALPTVLEHAPVALRHPRNRAFFRMAAAAMAGFRAALGAEGFTEIQTPKLVGSATEGGANVFRLDYFGRPAYLSQSPQLYKQIMVGVFERVSEVGPAFRAEPHDTPRHINAFVSLDVEQGFIADHRDVMATLTLALRAIVQSIAESLSPAELALTGARMPEVPAEIPAIHFVEALELLGGLAGEDLRAETDLAPAHERLLGEWARERHGSDFLFVTGYPTAQRAFYTAPDPARPGSSNAFDLLFRGVELVSGGQRLHRYEDYLAALAARGMSAESFAGYLEAFRHGMPPHGGFAIGLERLVMRLCELPNIREATLFPRDLTRLTP
ncbi:MAG TPA: aspartate--tRNA(Asn) ligase [Chloroflexaceae bacterium]|nr:aspartate--tRNA(Asn) ligase [Chloroflexaceae bacterium]